MIILPAANWLTKPHWDAAAQHEFRIQCCSDCGHWWHPPAPICPRCQSSRAVWERASGRGTVYSYTVAHHAFHPAVRDKLPYIIGLIDLDEGPRYIANIRNCSADSVAIGMRVSVTFEDLVEGIVLPQFEPADVP